jgi:hypothetical protein
MTGTAPWSASRLVSPPAAYFPDPAQPWELGSRGASLFSSTVPLLSPFLPPKLRRRSLGFGGGSGE